MFVGFRRRGNQALNWSGVESVFEFDQQNFLQATHSATFPSSSAITMKFNRSKYFVVSIHTPLLVVINLDVWTSGLAVKMETQ